jgi:amidophosphoribosyltransferase
LSRTASGTGKHIGDSELILETILAKAAFPYQHDPTEAVPAWILSGLKHVYAYCIGSFACVLLVPSYGLVAFRDANGIKPLAMGSRNTDHEEVDYMFSSESVAFRSLGYTLLRDVQPGKSL